MWQRRLPMRERDGKWKMMESRQELESDTQAGMHVRKDSSRWTINGNNLEKCRMLNAKGINSAAISYGGLEFVAKQSSVEVLGETVGAVNAKDRVRAMGRQSDRPCHSLSLPVYAFGETATGE